MCSRDQRLSSHINSLCEMSLKVARPIENVIINFGGAKMIPIVEFQNRSLSGPMMKMDEFDLMLAKKVRQLVKKYGLKYDPEKLIVDDQTADAIFNAGVEMLAEIGVYNVDTQRVIKWTTEEIWEMVTDYKKNPRTVTFGRGEDLITIKPRTSKDTWAPPLLASANHVAFKPEHLIPHMQIYAREKDVQGFVVAGGVSSVNGVDSQKGRPGEIYCSIWETNAQTEALQSVGRPDMFRGYVPLATTLGAILASFDSGMLEPYNSTIITHILPEQKVDLEKFNISFVCEQRGISPEVTAMSLLGGLCGGPTGAAIGCIANLLAQISYSHAKLGGIWFNDMAGRAISREALWAFSAAYTAVERNFGLATHTVCVDHGSYTISSQEEGIIGGVMLAITTTACGAALNECGGTTLQTYRIHADVMKGIAGMDKESVNKMLQKLSAKVDEMIAAADGHKLSYYEQTVPSVYNLETLEPKPEYLNACKRAIEILEECGVPISDKLVL